MKTNILVPHRLGKSLVTEEGLPEIFGKLIDLSSMNPKDLVRNLLRMHEPLASERKHIDEHDEELEMLPVGNKE